MQGPIELVQAPETARLHLRGELDLSTQRLLRRRLADVESSDVARVVVDACDVTFIDAGSLRVLDDARRRCAAGGVRLVVERASQRFRLVASLAEYPALLPPEPAVEGGHPTPRRLLFRGGRGRVKDARPVDLRAHGRRRA